MSDHISAADFQRIQAGTLTVEEALANTAGRERARTVDKLIREVVKDGAIVLPIQDGCQPISSEAKSLPRKKSTKKQLFERSEHMIQDAILKVLVMMPESRGFFWRENSGNFVMPGYVSKKTGEQGRDRFVSAGQKGIPDIMGIYKGVSVGIECKKPGKKPTPYQIAFMKRMVKAGGIAFVCTDEKNVLKQLEVEYCKRTK